MTRSMIELDGIEDVEAKLRALGAALTEAVVEATEAGGKVGAAIMEERAPGPHIGTEMDEVNHQAGTATIKIGPDKEHFYYAFLERGAAPHKIMAKNAGALVFQGREKLIMTKSVMHPGMAARPFMRRVAGSARAPVVTAVRDALRVVIETMT